MPDALRRHLYQQHGLYLAPREARINEERLLFYLAVTAPLERLILSYPRTSGEADALPSFYVDEVRDALDKHSDLLMVISRRLSDVAPRADDAQRLLCAPNAATSGSALSENESATRFPSWRDHLFNLCVPLFDPAVSKEQRTQAYEAIQQLCQKQAEAGKLLRLVAESRFLPPLPQVEEEAHRDWLMEKAKRCSVAELDVYARCPFRHFLQYRLQLKGNVENNISWLQEQLLSNILHRALAQYSGDLQAFKQALHAALDAELQELAADISPHRERLLHQGLLRVLEGIVEREAFYNKVFSLQPAHIRLAFGVQKAAQSEYDPASSIKPLQIPDPQGGDPIALYGSIARVDVDAETGTVFLADYAATEPPPWNEWNTGKALRLPLLLWALEQVFNKQVGGAWVDVASWEGRMRLFCTHRVGYKRFKLLEERESGRNILPMNEGQYWTMLQVAIEKASHLVNAMRQGNIQATPGPHCRLCPYSDICRTTPQGHDGEPLHKVTPVANLN